MTLKPGQSTGQPQNEHPRSEQWLVVLSGRGVARVNRRRVALRERGVLLIEKGEIHSLTNDGRKPLVTISFYAPPAYSRDGEVRENVAH